MDNVKPSAKAEDIRSALARLLASEGIVQKPSLCDILSYIVEEELADRGDRLKAYTIGIDALNRDADFDPSSDSIVRVQANRLRQAISAYYAGDGADDSIHITVPKGSYRPVFERRTLPIGIVEQADTSNSGASVSTLVAPHSRKRPIIIGGIALSAVAMGAVLLMPHDELAHMQRTPVIDIRPFEIDTQEALAPTIQGMREQLVVDLAHLGTVEIRDFGSGASDPNLDPSDYDLSGSAPLHSGPPRLLLKLRSTSDGNVVWSKTLDLPNNDEQFYSLLRDVVGGIAVELAGKQGVVPADIIRRLDLRVETLGRAETSEYECLLLAYTYDLTKDEKAQKKAQTCLTKLTDAGSTNSSVWAEHSLVTFLSSSTVTEDTEAALLMVKSMAAARMAVRLDPYNAMAREQLGTVLSILAKHEEAIAEFKRGLELAPAKPSLYWQLGWQTVLAGDWEGGMELVSKGVKKSPFAPGWMRIPLALDAFRRKDYAGSLDIAKAVIQLGDKRGLSLAFAAAVGMDDMFTASDFLAQMRLEEGFDEQDPFRAVRRSYSNPSIMADYDHIAQDSGLL